MTYSEVQHEYDIVIGIETHVQLATKSKLFCGCDNDSREAEPNTHVCPVCLGLPGTLPVLNAGAVDLALRLGLALGAKEAQLIGHTKWDRKNYFYPDLPKGYQISQFDQPIVQGGWVELPDGSTIGITRAHLEEDAGKLIHPEGADYSLLDLNRAGTPLLEVVSEPDIRSAAQARAYAQELYNLVRYAGVSDANLYYGNMRFDVNVSLRKKGHQQFGTRTETKNLNSFRAIERAVEYEAVRQAEVLGDGGRIRQETRGWNEDRGQTYPMRSKEDADEYRYFPEPDLPPLEVTKAMLEAVRQSEIKATAGEAVIEFTPAELRDMLSKAGIPAADAEVLISADDLHAPWVWYHLWQENPSQARFAFNWLVTERPRLAEAKGRPFSQSDISSLTLALVGKMTDEGQLSSTNAKILLEHLWDKDTGPQATAHKLGLIQQSDTGELDKVVGAVIKDNPSAVADYQSGNQRAIGALVGAAMKATKGQGNPQVITQILRQKLG